MRTTIFFIILTFAGFLFPFSFLEASQRKPNVLLIMTDDQGWGDIRSHGNNQLDTPVLDKLAARGARLDRFFVSPVCAPTRASLLTGRYHLRTGVHGVTRGYETLRSEETTLAEALRQAGYATGIFGKWHNGAHYPHHPNGQGFDEFVGFCAGHWNNYFNTTLERNGKPFKSKGYITDVLTDHALQFMVKNKGQPFFCYVAYNAPHSPFQVPDKYFQKYKKRGLDDKTACVYGMVENIDDNVGRLLANLQDLDLEQDTIVIFLTDNGPNSDRYNGGMLGRKGSVHEGGIRVPCFISWPGHIKPGTIIPQIAAHIDLFPTILDLAGVSVPKGLTIDGLSLRPLLLNQAKNWPDRLLFAHQAKGDKVGLANGSVRSQKYRLVYLGKQWELYDMENDPGQKKNIASQNPQEVQKLRQAYEKWFKEVTAPGFERLPIPVGYKQAPLVVLPAPECYLNGAVKYKGKAGWANDWITNWKSTKDTISWDIEVVQPETFEISLLYLCPKADVGSKISVEIGGQQLTALLQKAHNPKPLPSPDLVPRGEVYEMEWADLPFGTLKLNAGKTRLVVRALTCPGSRVMELKGVKLKRVE